jgi:hypothetical protein
MPSPALHLVIPGLLGPWPDPGLVPAGLRLPALGTLLARADPRPEPDTDPQAALFRLFGQAPGPVAGVTRLGAGLPAADGCWLHADPVHLRPDMDRLLVFDQRVLAIGAEEAAELVSALNDHFGDRGWHLEAADAGHWYLHLAEVPAIETSPLHAVTGRGLFPHLPRGADARAWHGLLNEAQMALFQVPANQRRRNAGRPEINGLWVWGGGRLPAPAPAPWAAVLGRGELLAGLCVLGATPAPREPTELPAELPGDTLLYRDDPFAPVLDADPAGWATALERLSPLLEAALAGLARGRWSRLLLYPCNGHSLELSRRGLRRFWRRPRPLASVVTHSPRP